MLEIINGILIEFLCASTDYLADSKTLLTFVNL